MTDSSRPGLFPLGEGPGLSLSPGERFQAGGGRRSLSGPSKARTGAGNTPAGSRTSVGTVGGIANGTDPYSMEDASQAACRTSHGPLRRRLGAGRKPC